MKLSDLAPGDVAEWDDPPGKGAPRFVFHGIADVPSWGPCADIRYEGGGGISEPCLSRSVRRLGRGRLVPARIAMDEEPDLAAQVATLRAALTRIHAWATGDYQLIPKRFVADVAEAALAATAPPPPEAAK